MAFAFASSQSLERRSAERPAIGARSPAAARHIVEVEAYQE
jgi:hypothetical protein